MTTKLIPLILSLFLLCGCAAQRSEPEDAATVSPPAAEQPQTFFSLPEAEPLGPVRTYDLDDTVSGFLPLGSELLLFSDTADSTVLTLVDPESMTQTASHAAEFLLPRDHPSVQLWEDGISWFDSDAGQTVVLDSRLREIRRIRIPEDCIGFPLLSHDRSALYYCTATAVRALDTNSGISRILKEASYSQQAVSALLLEDSVLQISITDTDAMASTLFLSTENGQLLKEYRGSLEIQASDDTYWALVTDGVIQTCLFGQNSDSPSGLHPHNADTTYHFLPGSRLALTVGAGAEGNTLLDLYDLTSGRRTAAASLPGLHALSSFAQTCDGSVWFLRHSDGQPSTQLCCWDPTESAITDSTVYTGTWFTKENPDYDGLAACSLYAQQIGEKYGLEILIYKEAVKTAPWDYTLEYEYQASVLQQELERLDQHLGNFPEGFLQTLAGNFTALNICIIRNATGSPESGSPLAVNGIQFRDGTDVYIALSSSHDTEYALYHELGHLIEMVILTESTAYDQWDRLNPDGFEYDYDYVSNRSRDGSQWLQEGKEAFIDTYSMSYPKEDRARILEYAMTSGNADRFRSPALQKKLRQICTGIREAFHLEDSSETYLWEQYLLEPLV